MSAYVNLVEQAHGAMRLAYTKFRGGQLSTSRRSCSRMWLEARDFGREIKVKLITFISPSNLGG